MGRAYSIDLRERVISAIESGLSCHQAAAHFRVAVSTAVKWAQRFRATGSVAPGRIGGYRPKGIRGEHRDGRSGVADVAAFDRIVEAKHMGGADEKSSQATLEITQTVTQRSLPYVESFSRLAETPILRRDNPPPRVFDSKVNRFTQRPVGLGARLRSRAAQALGQR
jgi:hypothetical protein